MLAFTVVALAISLACFVVASAVNHVRDPNTTGVARINWMAVGLAVWVLLQLVVTLVAR
jgi:hypothetical protein